MQWTFDGTIVVQEGRKYNDVETPLEFLPGALEGLQSLKRAGHKLLLYSARANRALLRDPEADPMVGAGVRKVDWRAWYKSQPVHAARYVQMLDFVKEHLAGIIDAVDDGYQGKPSADLFIDDRALRFGFGPVSVGWQEIANTYGDPIYVQSDSVITAPKERSKWT